MDQSHTALNQTVNDLSIFLQKFMNDAKRGKRWRKKLKLTRWVGLSCCRGESSKRGNNRASAYASWWGDTWRCRRSCYWEATKEEGCQSWEEKKGNPIILAWCWSKRRYLSCGLPWRSPVRDVGRSNTIGGMMSQEATSWRRKIDMRCSEIIIYCNKKKSNYQQEDASSGLQKKWLLKSSIIARARPRTDKCTGQVEWQMRITKGRVHHVVLLTDESTWKARDSDCWVQKISAKV